MQSTICHVRFNRILFFYRKRLPNDSQNRTREEKFRNRIPVEWSSLKILSISLNEARKYIRTHISTHVHARCHCHSFNRYYSNITYSNSHPIFAVAFTCVPHQLTTIKGKISTIIVSIQRWYWMPRGSGTYEDERDRVLRSCAYMTYIFKPVIFYETKL